MNLGNAIYFKYPTIDLLGFRVSLYFSLWLKDFDLSSLIFGRIYLFLSQDYKSWSPIGPFCIPSLQCLVLFFLGSYQRHSSGC